MINIFKSAQIALLKIHKGYILPTWAGIPWNIMHMMIAEILIFSGTGTCYSTQTKRGHSILPLYHSASKKSASFHFQIMLGLASRWEEEKQKNFLLFCFLCYFCPLEVTLRLLTGSIFKEQWNSCICHLFHLAISCIFLPY